MNLVRAIRRSKFRACIDKDRYLLLPVEMDIDDHIGLFVRIDIAELQCDGSEAAIIAHDIRHHVGHGFSRIRGHHLNHDRLVVQVHSDKMAWVRCTIVAMAYNHIGLIGARHAVFEIVVALRGPIQNATAQNEQHEHGEHTDTSRYQPVYFSGFILLLVLTIARPVILFGEGHGIFARLAPTLTKNRIGIPSLPIG